MKGIVITSHGPMAQGILETSKLFFGEQPQMVARCLNADDNPDEFVNTLKDAVAEVDAGDGVIVFCDMLFGSPCNCIARVLAENIDNPALDVVTGVNLAMILQVLAVRENAEVPIEDLLNAGKDGIVDLKATLKQNMQ